MASIALEVRVFGTVAVTPGLRCDLGHNDKLTVIRKRQPRIAPPSHAFSAENLGSKG